MDDKQRTKISKYLSKHLRHQPERLGLELGPGGWIEVTTLLAACAAHRFPISRSELDEVVTRNDKQRFSFDETGTQIRANQGHSVDVDLQLEPVEPPAILYHGTGAGSVSSILATGLDKGKRHHVHLSLDVPTAIRVGSRHGKPRLFAIDAAAMHRAGHQFYCSANGVWLVEHVPTAYLTLLDETKS
jgi:putative RNA 2'-phosphotransferase